MTRLRKSNVSSDFLFGVTFIKFLGYFLISLVIRLLLPALLAAMSISLKAACVIMQ